MAALITQGLLDAEANFKSVVAIGANTENCMVVRGWRVVQVSADTAESIAKLNQPDLAARLSPWVGAPGTLFASGRAGHVDVGNFESSHTLRPLRRLRDLRG